MVLSSAATNSGNTSRHRLCDHANDLVVRIFSVDDSCSPLQNNLLCCLLTICYTKACLEGIAYLRRKLDSAQSSSCYYYSKQLLYATLCSNVLFWPLFDDDDGAEDDNWSWRLNIVVPSAMLVRFIYKGAILKDPDDTEVQTFSRSSAPTELLFGPAQLAAVLILLGLYRFKTEEAAVLTAALVGDLVAPVVGALFGRHDYQMPFFSSQKTMEGSLCGVFLATCSSVYFFLYCFAQPFLPLRVVLIYAGIAAVVEGTAPAGLDNLAVPLILTLSKDRVRSFLDTWIGCEEAAILHQAGHNNNGTVASAAAEAVSSTLGDVAAGT